MCRNFGCPSRIERLFLGHPGNAYRAWAKVRAGPDRGSTGRLLTGFGRLRHPGVQRCASFAGNRIIGRPKYRPQRLYGQSVETVPRKNRIQLSAPLLAIRRGRRKQRLIVMPKVSFGEPQPLPELPAVALWIGELDTMRALPSFQRPYRLAEVTKRLGQRALPGRLNAPCSGKAGSRSRCRTWALHRSPSWWPQLRRAFSRYGRQVGARYGRKAGKTGNCDP